MEADFRKGDKEITLDELIRLIKNHEYSKFIVEGLGETTIENVLFEQVVAEYESNKHYIELGKAVEKAFESGYLPTNEGFQINEGLVYINKTIKTVEELLKWAEGRE